MDPPPIFSLWKNTLRTVSHTPVPQAGRLADGQVRPPVSSFPNLGQVPVDHSAHIRYTDLAFSFASQTKNKATSEVWKPFWGQTSLVFMGSFCNRPLAMPCLYSSLLFESWTAEHFSALTFYCRISNDLITTFLNFSVFSFSAYVPQTEKPQVPPQSGFLFYGLQLNSKNG